MMGKSRKRKADESETKEDKKTLKSIRRKRKTKRRRRKRRKRRKRRTRRTRNKKDKKDKKTRRTRKDKIRTGSDETLVSKESSATPPQLPLDFQLDQSGLSKRASVMDSKALNEIFMITN